MTHWATRYIGKRWDQFGDGVDTFNCWTFVQAVQRDHFGHEVPDLGVDATDNREIAKACTDESKRQYWKYVEEPLNGDCVLFARVKVPVHVGVWIEANGSSGVLHCAENQGVLFQTRNHLRMAGWGKLYFYRWVG